MKHDQDSLWLDALRGLCALVVVWGHTWNPLFTDVRPLDVGAGWGWELVHFIGGKFHDAVIVFFVLSGFFVGGSVLRSLERFRWRDYLVARLSRLWIVIAPALALLVLVCWGLNRAVGEPWPADMTWPNLLGNLFFLQGWGVEVIQGDSPLWSLAYEFWYYLLFPLFAVGLFALSVSRPRKALGLALGAGLLWALPLPFRQSFCVWLMGALLWWGVRRKGWRSSTAMAWMAALCLAAVLLKERRLDALLGRWGYDLVVGASVSWFCLGLLTRVPPMAAGKFRQAARFMADCSFSVYAVHYFVLTAADALYFRHARAGLDLSGALLFGLVFTGAVASGAAFWWLFERHYLRLRGWVSARLPGSAA